MRKRLWMLLGSVALILCVAFGAAACGGDDETEKTALSTPQNVVVSDGTLFWDPVEHAEEYTVRINSDESTVVNGESLKLSTVASKLRNGANSLSVRANETAEYAASGYSAAVSYTYSPQETGKVKLGTPMGVAVRGDSLTWEAVLNASGYVVKIGEDETTAVTTNSLDLTTVAAKLAQGPNALSVKATGTGNYTDGDYSASVEYIHRVPFAAPQNLRVDVSTLRWDAVDGAASYTVKINSDETTVVTTNELDLTTVTGKLTLENQLSVKVNPNEVLYLTESAYSAEVGFHYNPQAVAAAKAFEDTVNAITTVTQDNTQEEATAAKTAIDAAETAYTALDDEAKEYAEAAKATLDAKKAAYMAQTEGAKTAHSAFAAYLLAAEQEMEKKASAAALEEAIETVKTAKGELSTLANGLVTAEETGRIQTLDGTLSAWKAEIAAAVEELGGLPEPDPENDATAESIIVAADELLETYAAYEAYVKADEGVTAAHTALETAKAAAQAQIEATVMALKAAVDEALENTEASVENYEALIAVQAKASALGAYASEKYADYKKADIEGAIKTMLETAVDTRESVSILINQDANTAKVVILRMFVNILGNMVKYSETPQVTATAAIGEGEPASIEATVSYSEEKGVYAVTLPFTRQTAETVTVSYQIGEEEQAALKIGANSAIRYFPAATQNGAYDEQGKIALAGGSGDTHYVDIYRADDVDAGESRTSDISLSAFPLFSRVDEKDVDTLQKLKGYLARNGYRNEMSVRLVSYDRTEQDGVVTVSAINNASVSAAVEVDIGDDDARLDVFHRPGNLQDFNWALDGGGGHTQNAWEIFNSDLWDGVDIVIYDANGIPDVQSHDFLGETPFAIYHFDSEWAYWTNIDEAIRAAWKAIPYEDRGLEFTFVFAIRLQPNEEAERLGYLPSLLNYAQKDGQRETKQYNFIQAIGGFTFNDNGVWDGAHDFTFIGTPTEAFLAQFNGLIDGYELTADNAIDYLEILVEVVLDESPDEVAFSKAVPFKARSYSFDRLAMEWKKAYFATEGAEDGKVFTFKIYYSVQIKAKVGDTEENNLLAAYFTPSEKKTINEKALGDYNCRTLTMSQADLKATSLAQFNFAGTLNVEFLRAMGNGSVFSVYGAAYVELKFSKGEQEYSVYLFNEDGNLVIYGNTERTTTSLTCGSVTNSWTSAAQVSGKINEWYGADIDIQDGWEARTKVHVDENSLWAEDGDWSEPAEYTIG